MTLRHQISTENKLQLYLLSFSWQRTIATPVTTLCSLPLKLTGRIKEKRNSKPIPAVSHVNYV